MSTCMELGPIRPPSEARSLLVRVTRNCPWNRCEFCGIYKGAKFALRSVEEIARDLDHVSSVVEAIQELSSRVGQGGKVSPELLSLAVEDRRFASHEAQMVLQWLYFGGRSVFLQDANTLIARTPDLVRVLESIRERFPFVERVTTYARSHTAARKKPEELRALREAGLTRVHVGLESGCDAVLKMVNKGVTGEDQIRGGKRIVEAGLSLSEYVMPGLGGVELTREHALDTARVLTEINPDYIRFRTLTVTPGMPLWDRVERGDVTLLPDDDIVREIRMLLENLGDAVTSKVVSDHVLNLLEEVRGELPDDRERILEVIDDYLGMADEDRRLFRIARRAGLASTPADLGRPALRARAEALLAKLTEVDDGEDEPVEDGLRRMMRRFI